MSYNPPKIDTKYGAPMGRASYIDYIPNPKSCTLQKVNMTSDGAYDTGGGLITSAGLNPDIRPYAELCKWCEITILNSLKRKP